MSKTSLYNCQKCEHGANSDCTSCKLANLSKKREEKEDEYSISERLSENNKDHSIFTLVIFAILILVCVMGFTMMFR